MDIFDALTLIGGLCLFGMNIHEAQRMMKSESEEYKALYKAYKQKYLENV